MSTARSLDRRRVLSSEEARVWRAVADTVTPLPGRERTFTEADGTKVAVSAPPPESSPPSPPVPAPAPPPRPRAPLADLSHGRAAGLDRRTAERMAKGDMAIDGRIDLHGMTQDAAHIRLGGFIARAYDTGLRCVLVITGKGRDGGGILRSQVPRWLNQSPLRERILGFSYARPNHGGDGALYVLIKRRRG